MIWGAYRRTFVCDMIAMAIGAITVVALWAVGLDAVIPQWLLLLVSTVVAVAAYRWRYGRL